jgi:hypothetical protein
MPNACSPYASTGPMGRGTITGPSKNSSKPLSFEAAISFNCTLAFQKNLQTDPKPVEFLKRIRFCLTAK